MTLTRPDFRLDKPNPDPDHITNAMWWYWLRFKELEPTVKLGGIYHPKKGFHSPGNTNTDHGQGDPRTNYSIRDAINRRGAGMTKSCGIDETFPDAQSGDYRTIDKYTSRLLGSALNPSDPRLDLILFEFYGQADMDESVEGYNERAERPVSSDDSHLWHIHRSIIRSEVDDFWGFWAMLTVDMGWSVTRWRASLPAAPKPPVITRPPAPTGLPVHKLGSRELSNKNPDMRGTDIRTFQTFIGKVPADGVFGDGTEARTKAYQRMRGLEADGIAGPKTLGPIVRALG